MEKINNKLVTLKKNKEFTFVYHRGKSCATRRMVLIYFKNRYGGIRSGFSVSKKVGKAVVRNKVRRRMKECMREMLGEMTAQNANLIFVARACIAEATYSEIRKDMRYLLKKAGLLVTEKPGPTAGSGQLV